MCVYACGCVGERRKKEKECEKCVLVCALTFQSMVEKNAWRLISSTPSGPAPKDTDGSGSVNPALLLFIDSSAHYQPLGRFRGRSGCNVNQP